MTISRGPLPTPTSDGLRGSQSLLNQPGATAARLLPNAMRSSTQAAFLEPLAAAARTRIVSAYPSEWIPVGFAIGKFGFSLLEIPLRSSAVVVAEPIPSGQFLNGIAEQREFVVLRMSRFTGSFDRPFEVPLEILEAESLPVDEATVEGPFDQYFEFTQAEHRNG